MLTDMSIGRVFSKPSAWLVMSVLLHPPFVAHQQSEIARTLRVSDATVQRGLKALISEGLVVRKRKQYAANLSHVATQYLWLLRTVERELALPTDVRAAISSVSETEQFRHATIVLFGSWAQASASSLDSDIDIALFASSLPRGSARAYHGRFTIDVHRFFDEDLYSLKNTAALDAVLNGIPLTNRGSVFDAATKVQTFPKALLLYRLNQAEAQLARATFLGAAGQEESAAMFREIAGRTVTQILLILEQGRTESWRTARPRSSVEAMIDEARARLAATGSQVWLT